MPANFLDLTSKVNRFRKGFMNGDPFDEPTYLTFAIEFDLLGERINPMTSLLASPLFNEADPLTSAKMYLGNYGTTSDAERVPKIKALLQSITDQTPWYFQSIDGVGDMWSNNTRMGPKLKSGTVLTVNCLESLDLRMLTIANLYRKMVFDQHNIRYKLPDNLRYFSMDIYLAEVRNFREILDSGITSFGMSKSSDSVGPDRLQRDFGKGGLTGGGTSDPNTQISISNALDHFGYLKYTCYNCEFDFSDSLRSMDNHGFTVFAQDKPFSTSFKIKIGYFEESHYLKEQFIGGGDSLDLLGIANDLGPFANVAKSALLRGEGALNKITSFPTQLVNTAVGELQHLVENGSLGNVYNQPPFFNETPLFDLSKSTSPSKYGAVGKSSSLKTDLYPNTPAQPGPNGLGNIYH